MNHFLPSGYESLIQEAEKRFSLTVRDTPRIGS